MIHIDAITLVRVCTHDNLRGLSIRRFLVKMTARKVASITTLSNNDGISQIGTSFTGIISTALSMMGFHRSIYDWQAKPRWQRVLGTANVLESFQRKVDPFDDTLSCCKYVHIVFVYTCIVMQFIVFKSIF